VYRLRKFVRRNRALVAGGAVVVVATIVFIAGLSAAWAKARRQEQIAQTVNQFLLDIINRADPKQGNKHSLADAIGDSERLLNSRQARERLPPEVQAAMKDTIGNAQRALGDYKAARTNLEAALKLRQQILSSDDPDIARTLDHLGHLTKDEFVENKDPLAFEAAKAQYDQAIVILEKSLSKDDLEVAAALANRASLFYEANKLAEADADCRRAMDIRDRRDAPPDDRLQSRGALVDVLRKRAEADPANRDRLFKEADELIRDAEQIAEGSDDLKAKSANPSPNRARLLTQKGKLLQAEGLFGEAIKAFEEAVKIDEQVLEPGHPYIAKAKKWLKEAQEAAEKKPAVATEEPGKPRRPRPNGPPGRPR
jgi:tetratricopeptide (TPR) repeat protein